MSLSGYYVEKLYLTVINPTWVTEDLSTEVMQCFCLIKVNPEIAIKDAFFH